MNEIVPIDAPTAANAQRDRLVARYAVLGAERRRKRRLTWVRRGVLASGALCAVAASLAGWHFGALQPGLDEVRALQASLTSELAMFQAGRAELSEQRVWLERQSGELTRRLAEFDRRAAALEAEDAELRTQTARLEAALVRADEERRALLAAAPITVSPQPVDAREDVRRDLEHQRDEFVAQQSQVSSELDVLASRRLELGERRRALEEQRRELEALLARAEAEPAPDAEFAVASTVSPHALGDMRGGIQLRDGMNVSIGLTRSASINGVEQVTSSLSFDSLNRSIGSLATEGLGPVVIQNGPGNMIDASFINAVPGFNGVFIQNSLDDQVIDMSTVFDVSITDVGRTLESVAAGQALRDTLYFQQ